MIFFYRENPFHGAFAIAAGLEQAIDYIRHLSFSREDIEYLRSLGIFQEDFLTYLENFRFTGDIDAIPEGTVVFPREPLIRVNAPIIEAQLVETTLLNLINHQSLIATKAGACGTCCQGRSGHGVWSAAGTGSRRGHTGSQSRRNRRVYRHYALSQSVIGGCIGTSNVLTAQLFDVAPKGTHSHSWVMSFDSELEAFRAYAKLFPNMCILLVDTYDTLRSGVPNAIRVFQEMRDQGIHSSMYGIRLDSGDLAYLSIEAKKMLDAAGFSDAIISASSDLDEHLIRDLKLQGAQISLWGVGTKLITAQDNPSFGGVYKMAAEEDHNGQMQPKIKLSNNPEKITNPGVKKVLRIYDKASGYMKADLIALEEEVYDPEKDLTIFHPVDTW